MTAKAIIDNITTKVKTILQNHAEKLDQPLNVENAENVVRLIIEALAAGGADRLLLEQAKAFILDLRATARNAPYGKVIAHADAFAVQHGREFTRKALETIVQEQNDLLEKKTK